MGRDDVLFKTLACQASVCLAVMTTDEITKQSSTNSNILPLSSLHGVAWSKVIANICVTCCLSRICYIVLQNVLR